MRRNFVFLLSWILIFCTLFVPLVNSQDLVETETSEIAIRDTFLDENNPTENHATRVDLWCGHDLWGGIQETYIYFDFNLKPDANLIEAELSLDFWLVWQLLNVTICIIEESWTENMLWSGRPTKGQIIGNVLIAEEQILTLDVTDLVESRSSLSICLYVELENKIDDIVWIGSREATNGPQINWTYLAEAPPPEGNPPIPWDLIIGIGGGLVGGSIITLIIVGVSKKKKKGTS